MMLPQKNFASRYLCIRFQRLRNGWNRNVGGSLQKFPTIVMDSLQTDSHAPCNGYSSLFYLNESNVIGPNTCFVEETKNFLGGFVCLFIQGLTSLLQQLVFSQ